MKIQPARAATGGAAMNSGKRISQGLIERLVIARVRPHVLTVMSERFGGIP